MTPDLVEVRRRAEEAERKQDWESASRLRDIVALESPSAGFWDTFFAIRATLYAGRSDEAFRRLCLLSIVPGTESARTMMRAEIEERRGRDAEAVEWWRKAAILQSDPYWALFGLARSLKRLGQTSEARQTMTLALALPSVESRGIEFAAVLDLQSGSLEEADAKLSALGLADDERSRRILANLPGMTSQAERWALFEAAGKLHGVGQAVDLGCWLGSLTISMALGLKSNPRVDGPGVRVHAYDEFVWLATYMDNDWIAGLPMARPADGESFLSAFQRIVAPWKHVIEIHQCDLMHAQWTGEPIELLSVDAMKSPELARRIVSEFYPSLLPGQSVVFHQDFCHGYTWWIHMYHFLLRRHFEVTDNLEGSAGVLFRFDRPFESGELEGVLQADMSDKALATEAFSYSMDLVAPSDRATIAAAYIRCELANGRAARAQELMELYRQDPVANRELAGLKEWTQLQSAPNRTAS